MTQTDTQPDEGKPAPAAAEAPLAGPPRRRRPACGTALLVAGVAVLALLVVVLVLAVVPVSTSGLGSQPDPAASYEDAVRHFEDAAAGETAVYAPCASRLMTHGHQTDGVVVLVHGLTNCPRQFVELGEEIYDMGANVLILRTPYHGLASEDGTKIGKVGNVVVTAWISQNRADVTRTVVIAPAITLPGRVPNALDSAFRTLFLASPEPVGAERRCDPSHLHG